MRSLLKRFIRSFGFDLRHYHPGTSEAAQIAKMLSIHEVDLVFDVGANTGQFGRFLRDAGYKGGIVSFEPTMDAWSRLKQESKSDPLWTIAPRAAIGDFDGDVKINLSANSVSSSVMNMLDAHSDAAPESLYVGSENVPMFKLDSLANDYLTQNSRAFLKIDTQGYEDKVLQGAADLLSKVVGIQLELSLVPLYEGQILFDKLIDQLQASGLALWSVTPVFTDPRSGRLLQVDATFFRE